MVKSIEFYKKNELILFLKHDLGSKSIFEIIVEHKICFVIKYINFPCFLKRA